MKKPKSEDVIKKQCFEFEFDENNQQTISRLISEDIGIIIDRETFLKTIMDKNSKFIEILEHQRSASKPEQYLYFMTLERKVFG